MMVPLTHRPSTPDHDPATNLQHPREVAHRVGIAVQSKVSVKASAGCRGDVLRCAESCRGSVWMEASGDGVMSGLDILDLGAP